MFCGLYCYEVVAAGDLSTFPALVQLAALEHRTVEHHLTTALRECGHGPRRRPTSIGRVTSRPRSRRPSRRSALRRSSTPPGTVRTDPAKAVQSGRRRSPTAGGNDRTAWVFLGVYDPSNDVVPVNRNDPMMVSKGISRRESEDARAAPAREGRPRSSDLRRWRRHLADERAEAAVYRDLAAGAPGRNARFCWRWPTPRAGTRSTG